MKIKKIFAIEVIPTSPFNFDSTFHKPDHFTSGDNYWQPGIRWQTWWWEGQSFGLKFGNKGTVSAPKLLLTIYGMVLLGARSFAESKRN